MVLLRDLGWNLQQRVDSRQRVGDRGAAADADAADRRRDRDAAELLGDEAPQAAWHRAERLLQPCRHVSRPPTSAALGTSVRSTRTPGMSSSVACTSTSLSSVVLPNLRGA